MAKAEIQITAKDAASRVIGQVKNSLGDLDKRTSALTKTLGGLAGPLGSLGGLVSVAGIAAAVKSTADYADNLGKLAQSAGVSTRAMSELAYAANLSGASQEEVAKGLQKIGVDAAAGGKKLAGFGIEVLGLDGRLKTSDALLAEFADRMASMGTPSERSAAAIALLGEEGAKLVPLLSGGSAGLKDMADEAQRFGKVVTDDAAKAAAEFNDNLTRMTAAADGLKIQLGNALLPTLTRFVDELLVGTDVAGGFFSALKLFGTSRTFDKPAEGAKFYKTEIERLAKARDRLIEQEGVLANTSSEDRKIEKAQQLLRYYEQLNRLDFRRNFTVNTTTAENDPRRGRGYVAPAPKPEDPRAGGGNGGRTATPREQISEAEKYIQTLQRQLEGVDQLTVKEQLLRDIGMGRLGVMTEAQQRDLLGLAEAIDLRRQLADQETERARLERETAEAAEQRNQAEQDYIRALLDSTPTGQLERQREEIARITALFTDAKISAEQYLEIVGTKLGTDVQDSTKKTDDLAKDLGLTFSSAFEDAIVGGKGLQGVLAGLEADIMRIVTRKLVTEPLGDFVSSAVGGFDWGSLFSFDGGGYTGPGGRYGGLDGKGGFMAMLHPNETVVDHTKGQSVGTRVQNINVTVSMPQSGQRATALQFGRDVSRQLALANARNG